MKFDVVVNDILSVMVTADATSSSNERTRLLALANDFEDNVWRFRKFHDCIWNNIAETSLSAKERASLTDQSMTVLRRSAMNLRLTDKDNDAGQGSEIAEILMYAVMKHHYKALPVIPKIFYKQNKNDPAKGADSVHIVLAQMDDDFTLWLGESKFYSDIGNSRLDKVIASVSDLLATEKIKKENSIIVGLTDLDELVEDGSVRSKIRNALGSDRSIDTLKPRLHVPILLLYECSITAKSMSMSEAYLKEICEHVKERAVEYFRRQSLKLSSIPGYENINFHLIVFPVPNKKRIVGDFVSFANVLRGGGL